MVEKHSATGNVANAMPADIAFELLPGPVAKIGELHRHVAKLLAGSSGNFLRYDIDVDDITDSRDRRWTRITQIYRLPPMGYRWNSYYWI
jgi:hypothetical protein